MSAGSLWAARWLGPRLESDWDRLWDSTIRLGEEFFNEVIAHPVPIDMRILKAVKRSPLGLNLYLWLAYRTFALKTPLTIG